MRTFGALLVVVGIALMLYGLTIDIYGSRYSLGNPVANVALIHKATLVTIIGGFLFLGGCVIAALGDRGAAEAGGEPMTTFHRDIPIDRMPDGAFRIRGDAARHGSAEEARKAIDRKKGGGGAG